MLRKSLLLDPLQTPIKHLKEELDAPFVVDRNILDEKDIEKKVIKYFSQFINLISLNEALAKFFVKHGPICSTSTVRKIIRKFENENHVEIIRNPATTDKGKPSSFMNEGKGKTISLRWLQ